LPYFHIADDFGELQNASVATGLSVPDMEEALADKMSRSDIW
jgi:hypothetical protein